MVSNEEHRQQDRQYLDEKPILPVMDLISSSALVSISFHRLFKGHILKMSGNGEGSVLAKKSSDRPILTFRSSVIRSDRYGQSVNIRSRKQA